MLFFDQRLTYYLKLNKIWELRDTNIAALINEIEGQSANSTGNLEKWREYFNFLIAPLNAGTVLCRKEGKTAAATSNFHTEFHIKATATWLCMQNAQVS